MSPARSILSQKDSLFDFALLISGVAIELPDGFTGLEKVLLDESVHLYLGANIIIIFNTLCMCLAF